MILLPKITSSLRQLYTMTMVPLPFDLSGKRADRARRTFIRGTGLLPTTKPSHDSTNALYSLWALATVVLYSMVNSTFYQSHAERISNPWKTNPERRKSNPSSQV